MGRSPVPEKEDTRSQKSGNNTCPTTESPGVPTEGRRGLHPDTALRPFRGRGSRTALPLSRSVVSGSHRFLFVTRPRLFCPSRQFLSRSSRPRHPPAAPSFGVRRLGHPEHPDPAPRRGGCGGDGVPGRMTLKLPGEINPGTLP